MLRNLLGLIAGVAACMILISAVQYLNSLLYPPPPGLSFDNPEDVPRIVAGLPLLALLMVELSYVVGSFGGGAVLGLIARSRLQALALGIGLLFTAFNLVNLVQIPHPLWLAVLTTITFMPLTWLGARLTGRERMGAAA
jgi:hypothetical protein